MADVQVKGLAELKAALDTIAPKMERNIVRGGLRAAGKVYVAEARAQAPKRTGALAESVRVSTRLRNGVPVAQVKAGDRKAWYAKLVEFGTAAHIIKARHGGALAIGGGTYTQVKHPGATARPFMRPAFDFASAAAIKAFGDYVRARLVRAGAMALDEPDEGGE